MMKKIGLALLCSLALGEVASAAVWFDVDASQIQFIRADGRAGLQGYFIQFTQSFPGDAGCSARDFAYIRKNDDLAKELYSTALAAYLAGKSITVGTTGCDAVGNVIQTIAVKNN